MPPWLLFIFVPRVCALPQVCLGKVGHPCWKYIWSRAFVHLRLQRIIVNYHPFSSQMLLLMSPQIWNLLGYWVWSETHKGLKRVTRVQCSWIFTFTIFGNLSDRYPFSTKWLPRDHHADVLRQEFCISRLKYTVKRQKMERERSKECSAFFFWRKGSFSSRNRLQGIQPCFLHDGAHGLFWNATKAVKFSRYILHSMAKTITFLKGNLCIFKCFIDVL